MDYILVTASKVVTDSSLIDLVENHGFSWALALITLYMSYKLFLLFIDDYSKSKDHKAKLDDIDIKLDRIHEEIQGMKSLIDTMNKDNDDKKSIIEQLQERQKNIIDNQDIIKNILKRKKGDIDDF